MPRRAKDALCFATLRGWMCEQVPVNRGVECFRGLILGSNLLLLFREACNIYIYIYIHVIVFSLSYFDCLKKYMGLDNILEGVSMHVCAWALIQLAVIAV